MKYYELFSASDVDASCAKNEEGVMLPGIEMYTLRRARVVVPMFGVDVTDPAVLDDFFELGRTLVLSPAACEFIKALSPCSDLTVIPATIENRQGVRLADEFYLAWSQVKYEIIDRALSDIPLSVAGGRIPIRISRWVCQPDKIPDYDLFRADSGQWVVTEYFKDRWEFSGLSGMGFNPIWSHEEGPLS